MMFIRNDQRDGRSRRVRGWKLVFDERPLSWTNKWRTNLGGLYRGNGSTVLGLRSSTEYFRRRKKEGPDWKWERTEVGEVYMRYEFGILEGRKANMGRDSKTCARREQDFIKLENGCIRSSESSF